MDENYDVFICCCGGKYDTRIAALLCRLFGAYRVPGYVRTEKNRVAGIFCNAELSDEVSSEALRHSRNLVLIWTPEAAGGDRAADALKTFKNSGGTGILLLLAGGSLKDYVDKFLDGGDEPLAVDISSAYCSDMVKKLKAEKLRVLAPIFGLKYDDLKQRHRERAMQRTIRLFAFIISSIFIIGAAGTFLWLQTDKARKEAERQTKAAAGQYELSSQAFHNIYIKVSEDFSGDPGMEANVNEAIDEIKEGLKGQKGIDKLFDELIGGYGGDRTR